MDSCRGASVVKHVARIGAVFGQRTQLWWDLPVIESFELLRDIYRVPPERYRKTRDELIALLDLERLLATPVRQLSLGQRMRCEIAASMLHEPRVLFLDEPTIGLDAVAKLAVRDFVKTLNRERGVTVILTTHDMHDVEALAERVIVIGKGVILADGSLASLRRGALAERRLWVHFAGERGGDERAGCDGAAAAGPIGGARVRSAHHVRASADRARRRAVRGRGRAPRGAAHRGSHRALLRAALGRSVMGTSALRPYQAVFRARFQLLLQYRAAALAGFGTQCWWGAIKVMVFAAFLRGAVASPMTLRQAVDYIWLGQAFLTLLPWSADPEIARMVRSGDVAYERLRPLDTYAFWYARAVARRTATPLLARDPDGAHGGRAAPSWSGLGTWGLSAPPNAQAAAVFARVDGARRRTVERAVRR